MMATIGQLRSPVAWRTDHLELIDQRALPHEVKTVEVTTVEGVVDAIRHMVVRGAPAIGICAAFGVALGIETSPPTDAEAAWASARRAAEAIEAARPTAVNLSWAVRRTLASALEGHSPGEVYEYAVVEATAISDEDRESSRRMGEFGRRELEGVSRVLTHCNTGRLISAGWGTALGVVYAKAEVGEQVEVYASETRPLLQGARITAWELSEAGIPVTVVTDAMSAALMASGRVQAVLVGCDRVALNGDTANKIGTLTHAIVAKAYGIPFYVVGPLSSFDPATGSGKEIVVEERAPEEVLGFGGVAVAPAVAAWNPAFDVTPSEYVTAFITDAGMIRPPYAQTIPAVLSAARRR